MALNEVIMLMHATAHGGSTDTVRESALKTDLEEKKSLATPETPTRGSIAPGFSVQRSVPTEICFVFFVFLLIAYIALFSALLSRLTALACGST